MKYHDEGRVRSTPPLTSPALLAVLVEDTGGECKCPVAVVDWLIGCGPANGSVVYGTPP